MQPLSYVHPESSVTYEVTRDDAFQAYNLALRLFPGRAVLATPKNMHELAQEISRILKLSYVEVEVEVARDGSRQASIRVGSTWYTAPCL